MSSRRSTRWVAGASVALLLVVGVLTWVLVARDGGDEPYVVTPPPASSSAAAAIEPVGAAQTLQALVNALSDRDRTAAAALAAPGDTATAELLGELADTAAEARVDDLAMRYVDATGGVAADGSWAAAVDVSWAYAGFDASAATAEVSVRFRTTGDGVAVVGIGGASSRTPVWLSGPVQVSRTPDLLVVAADGTDLTTYARRARAAVPTVARVLPAWRARLVVEVPADAAALEAALGVEAGYYGQIAAVTGTGGVTEPGAPVHVFVNPDVFDGLGRDGQQVVLAHEATHVATDAPSSTAPTWLVEGFADYVALRDTTLPLSKTAGQAARQVRDEGRPAALPSPEEFDTLGPHLGAVYEASWLICVTIAERGGDDALRRLYDAVGAGEPLDRALRREAGLSEAELVRAWGERLAALPGTP